MCERVYGVLSVPHALTKFQSRWWFLGLGLVDVDWAERAHIDEFAVNFMFVYIVCCAVNHLFVCSYVVLIPKLNCK